MVCLDSFDEYYAVASDSMFSFDCKEKAGQVKNPFLKIMDETGMTPA